LVSAICLDVCPWNLPVRHAGSKSTKHCESQFKISEELHNLSKEDWQKLDKLNFKRLFKESPVERTKFEGIKRIH